MTLLHYIAKAGAQGMGDVDEACRMCVLLLQASTCYFNIQTVHLLSQSTITQLILRLLRRHHLQLTSVCFILSQRGADVFVRCRWTNMTPLHYAVFFDVAPVVTLLLEHSNGIGNYEQ